LSTLSTVTFTSEIAMEIRNVAIIAHVDHGKTTLVDQILRQCDVFRAGQEVQERIMDSNDLERERGITITAKNFAVTYNGVRINLIDTPGHADFGGEVERVLKMADGVLLLVDAFEGPMPQTRFVLQKALQLDLKPVVVINKVDRPAARPDEVLDEIFHLFCELDATDEQLDFRGVYAAGRDGWAVGELEDERENLYPLLDMIVKHVPAPEVREGPLQMLVAAMDHSDYVGRIGIGRIIRGSLKAKDKVTIIKRDGSETASVVKRLYVFDNLTRTEVDRVDCGDICAVVGLDDVDIGDTLANPEHPDPLPLITVDEPTLSLNFMVNDSPFYGKDGKYVTSRQVRARLWQEAERDVALRVEDTASADTFKVSGRGILHMAILMETMRREGFEFMVGQPQVIYREIDGRKAEPVEVLNVDIPNELAGTVIEYASARACCARPAARSSCTTASSSTSTSRAAFRNGRPAASSAAAKARRWPSLSTACRTAAPSSSSPATSSTSARSSASTTRTTTCWSMPRRPSSFPTCAPPAVTGRCMWRRR
jgi:GTP-binding protein